MQKQLVFMITAAALLTAIGSASLYTVHIANAQRNMTSAGGAINMTKGSNMTGAAGNTTGGSTIPATHPAGLPPGITPAEKIQSPIHPYCRLNCGGPR